MRISNKNANRSKILKNAELKNANRGKFAFFNSAFFSSALFSSAIVSSLKVCDIYQVATQPLMSLLFVSTFFIGNNLWYFSFDDDISYIYPQFLEETTTSKLFHFTVPRGVSGWVRWVHPLKFKSCPFSYTIKSKIALPNIDISNIEYLKKI